MIVPVVPTGAVPQGLIFVARVVVVMFPLAA